MVQGLADTSHIVSVESERFRTTLLRMCLRIRTFFFKKSGGKEVKEKSLRQRSKIFLLKSSKFTF